MEKILVLAEKESAALSYANALGCTKRVGYYDNDKYIITFAQGHLFSLFSPNDYDEKYKNWNINNLPIVPDDFLITKDYNLKIAPNKERRLKVISNLFKKNRITLIINGGDAGREGELIQRYILEYLKTNVPVKRLWLSTLTDEDIRKGFNDLKEGADYDNLYYSALARARLDWLIGMNYTQVMTIKANTKITIGRVQTPVLRIIVDRDYEILNFESKPFYEVESNFQLYSKNELYSSKLIDDDEKVIRFTEEKKAEDVISKCEKMDAYVKEIVKKKKKKSPPQLFNLTGLQKVMANKYGYSAQETLDLAQELYDGKKIMSYPRTSSRHLSKSYLEEFPKILSVLNFGEFEKEINKLNLDDLKTSKRFVDDSKISDHHALVPNSNDKMEQIYNGLNDTLKNVFREVVKSLLCQFANDYVYEQTRVKTVIDNKYTFLTVGNIEIDEGWKSIYNFVDEDSSDDDSELVKLPNLQNDEEVSVKICNKLDKKTSPPSKYTISSLLGVMETNNLGTDATRAGIIKALIETKKFISLKGKSYSSTSLGRSIIDNIKIEDLKSIEKTKNMEIQLTEIENGKLSFEDFLQNEIKIITDNIETIKNSKIEISNKKNKKNSTSKSKKSKSKVKTSKLIIADSDEGLSGKNKDKVSSKSGSKEDSSVEKEDIIVSKEDMDQLEKYRVELYLVRDLKNKIKEATNVISTLKDNIEDLEKKIKKNNSINIILNQNERTRQNRRQKLLYKNKYDVQSYENILVSLNIKLKNLRKENEIELLIDDLYEKMVSEDEE